MLKTKNNKKTTSFSDRKYAQIFNIGLNSTSTSSVLRFLRYRMSEAKKFFIITLNPEIVSLAEKDEKYAQVLNSADLALPDGIGLKFAAKFLGQPSITIIKGRKLFEDIIKLANKKSWRIFLLGGKTDEAEETAEKLGLSYKKVKFLALSGPILDSNADPVSEKDREIEIEIIEKINRFQPEILFVGFGAPKQEKWACKWFSRLSVGGIMVVGGTFRYISGQAKLPPEWMEEAGLEWLWRLLTEPWRFRRILTAVFIFPLRVLLHKFKNINNI